jgi:hypothetical protein
MQSGASASKRVDGFSLENTPNVEGIKVLIEEKPKRKKGKASLKTLQYIVGLMTLRGRFVEHAAAESRHVGWLVGWSLDALGCDF